MKYYYGITNLRTFEVVKVETYDQAIDVAASMRDAQITALDEREMPVQIMLTCGNAS